MTSLPILGLDKKRVAQAHAHHNLKCEKIPQHIAIVMDGNGRWAKKRGKARLFGHKAGVEALRRAIKACANLGIHYLSVYAFSTENWKRPKTEVTFLMELLKKTITLEVPKLKKEGARVKCFGKLSDLDPSLQKSIQKAEAETKDCTTLQVNLMINYGSRMEILDATKKIASTLSKEAIQELDEKTFTSYLYTTKIPDPEIFIRTSGETRISNYLLWQISYSELFFISSFWPDFDEKKLAAILDEYSMRSRRFGGL